MSFIDWFNSLLKAGKGTSSFGQTYPGLLPEAGQDVSLPLGTPVPSPAGTVTGIVPWQNGESLVNVDTGGGVTIGVGHLFPNVRIGQKLSDGQTLGVSGGKASPGYSTGPHIEVQYRKSGVLQNPLQLVGSAVSDVGSAAGNVASAVGATAQAAVSAAPNPPNPGKLVGDVLTSVAGWFLRIPLTILGILSIGTGLYILFRPQVIAVTGTAGKVAKVAGL